VEFRRYSGGREFAIEAGVIARPKPDPLRRLASPASRGEDLDPELRRQTCVPPRCPANRDAPLRCRWRCSALLPWTLPAATVPLPHLRPHVTGEVGPSARLTPRARTIRLQEAAARSARVSRAADPSRPSPNISPATSTSLPDDGGSVSIQFGPQGQQSEGSFYISSRARGQDPLPLLAPPQKLDVIADGRNVAIREQPQHDGRTSYPLSKTAASLDPARQQC